MIVCPLQNLKCPHNTFVALGTFDGLHLGHQAVIRTTTTSPDLLPTVLSVIPVNRLDALLTNQQRQSILSQMGVEQFVPAPLEDIRHLTPEEFFEEVLVEKLHAKQIVCGFNFLFGKNAAGDTEVLQELCDRHEICLTVVDAIHHQGQPVSSSRIRTALKQGDLSLANTLLGRPFAFSGIVSVGQQIGRTLGFPTINLPLPEDMIVPKKGVYAATVTHNEHTYQGVCNIGRHPTVGSLTTPLAETHILDFDGHLYGQTVGLQLIHFLREECRFDSLEQLKAAIADDIAHTRHLFEGEPHETV